MEPASTLSELKVTISKESLLFYIPVEGKDLIVYNLAPDYFAKFLPDKDLKAESTKLQKKYTELTGQFRDIKYFEGIIIAITEKLLFNNLDKTVVDNERLKSFLIYHTKTLTSIKNAVGRSRAEGIDYIDTELYNMSVLKIDDMFKILDAITTKRKKK